MNRNERHRASEKFREMFSNDSDIKFVHGDRNSVLLQFKTEEDADRYIASLEKVLNESGILTERV